MTDFSPEKTIDSEEVTYGVTVGVTTDFSSEETLDGEEVQVHVQSLDGRQLCKAGEEPWPEGRRTPLTAGLSALTFLQDHTHHTRCLGQKVSLGLG